MPNDAQGLFTPPLHSVPMLVLGIESSCDETGVALVRAPSDGVPQLLAHALHTQVAMHEAYGGVVPELASRDHIRRVIPLAREVMQQAQQTVQGVDVIAYTRGPGLAGALLVGAGVAWKEAEELAKAKQVCVVIYEARIHMAAGKLVGSCFRTNDGAAGTRQNGANAATFYVDLQEHESAAQTNRVDGVQVVLLLQQRFHQPIRLLDFVHRILHP